MMRLNFVYLCISVHVTITTTHMPPGVQELRPVTPGEFLYVEHESDDGAWCEQFEFRFRSIIQFLPL